MFCLRMQLQFLPKETVRLFQSTQCWRKLSLQSGTTKEFTPTPSPPPPPPPPPHSPPPPPHSPPPFSYVGIDSINIVREPDRVSRQTLVFDPLIPAYQLCDLNVLITNTLKKSDADLTEC